VSFICGIPLAMEESRMMTFRGGRGNWESRDDGWYAVLVCIFRLEDICAAWVGVKRWRTCWHGWREVEDCDAVNLMSLDGDFKDATIRCIDMFEIEIRSSMDGLDVVSLEKEETFLLSIRLELAVS
jgi:hypothetical protein